MYERLSAGTEGQRYQEQSLNQLIAKLEQKGWRFGIAAGKKKKDPLG